MLSNTSARARWGLAAAAIVVAVVVGGALITGNRSQPGVVGAPATPISTPTIGPSATPSPTPPPVVGLLSAQMVPCPVRPAVTCLKPGEYELSSPPHWPTRISFDVPEGWWEWFPGNVLEGYEGIFADSPAEGGSGWGLMFTTVGEVSRDPCDPNAPVFKPTDVDTPAELAAAMATWPGFKATTPVPVSVDRAQGLLVELTSTRTFKQCPDGKAFMWKTPLGILVDPYPMVDQDGLGRAGHFRILDIDGQLVVLRTDDFPGASPYEVSQGLAADSPLHMADQVEMQGILDSIRLGAPKP